MTSAEEFAKRFPPPESTPKWLRDLAEWMEGKEGPIEYEVEEETLPWFDARLYPWHGDSEVTP